MRFNSRDLLGCSLGGRYKLLRLIKQGGMGTVYSARDLRLERSVAVKVVLPSMRASAEAQSRMRERLELEAKFVAGLPRHDNLVAVYDYGTDSTLNVDFIVMEEVKGVDLGAVLRRQRLPVHTTIRIIAEVAAGLWVGHAQGLVHCDVKPENIMLETAADGSSEIRARLIDFGIAARLGTVYRTMAGLPHTPAYASPEQLGSGDEITPASDVFSMGIVLYEMLCGARPFEGTERESVNWSMLENALAGVAGASEFVAALTGMLALQPLERIADGQQARLVLLRAETASGWRGLEIDPATCTGLVTAGTVSLAV